MTVASPNLKDDLASLRIDNSARAGGSRKGLGFVLVALVVLIGTAGWLYSRGIEAAEVKTAVVTPQTGAAAAPGAVLNASGYVTARRRATVSSKVTGKVVEVLVEEGQAVKAGEVLARLDDSQIRAALNVARAQLEAARRATLEDEALLREAELTQQRRRQLLKEGVIGRAELDSSEAQVESLKARIAMGQQQIAVAESQVAATQTDLNDMIVRAPFSGVAISKDAQPGEMISPVSAGGGFTRTGICTIVDMTSLEIEVDVSESYINRVRENQPVEAVLDAYPDWRIPAHVITTVPSADRQKATVRVRIGFDASVRQESEAAGSRRAESRGERLDSRILPDMGVKVSFLNERPADDNGESARARILVPKTAVRTDNGATVVFVVNDERVERRAVRVGADDAGQVEVVSGLNAGERIVVDGPATLSDGARVKEQER
jgi:RND family efflux transporter MFP subunit